MNRDGKPEPAARLDIVRGQLVGLAPAACRISGEDIRRTGIRPIVIVLGCPDHYSVIVHRHRKAEPVLRRAVSGI